MKIRWIGSKQFWGTRLFEPGRDIPLDMPDSPPAAVLDAWVRQGYAERYEEPGAVIPVKEIKKRGNKK